MTHSNDLIIYSYNGGIERVSDRVEKLMINHNVQVLPDKLCYDCTRLKEVTFPKGLKSIGNFAFSYCGNLLEIRIGSQVEYIGKSAFVECWRLAKVEFEADAENSESSGLQVIDRGAFNLCFALQRIKLPSSVHFIGKYAFDKSDALMEANLSKCTNLRKISDGTFLGCPLLQTVHLPNMLRLIGNLAFRGCSKLVTVMMHLDSPIRIGAQAFDHCKQLANLVLPKGCIAEKDSFRGCELLHGRYGANYFDIVAGLIGRFDYCVIHKMCFYGHTATSTTHLRQCIAEVENCWVDRFGMTPLHVFLSTAEPTVELLSVLLESLPNQLLNLKDANGRRPLDYLINNWADGSYYLLQMTLQKCMIDWVARWNVTSWVETIQRKVQEILDQDDKEQRKALCNEAYSIMEHCENLQATTILEIALWKNKLKSGGISDDGSKLEAREREEYRCMSGSDVVIFTNRHFLGHSTNLYNPGGLALPRGIVFAF